MAFTPDSEGVILAQGSRFGGHALFVKDGTLTHYVYNLLGIAVGPPIVGVEVTKGRVGEYHESHGPLKLHIDAHTAAEQEIRTMTGYYALCGEGLCIGDVADDAYVDVEQHLAAATARD